MRELLSYMMKSIPNDKLYEKCKIVVEKEDLESISVAGYGNSGSTRYGTSMRGSSLDARSAG
jgi:hypothetical protein